LDYKIDFSEPIPKMIVRLKREHHEFELNLENIQKRIDKIEIKDAVEITKNMRELIIKHAVEEEARLMRVIMQKAKDESSESIRIMQEHNWIMDFFKNKLGAIENRINSKIDSQKQEDGGYYVDKIEQSKKELNEFIANLRNHFSEEEQIVFPLVLKAELL
jgi:tetrahydromethanopterin S-methyltransferase subunit A